MSPSIYTVYCRYMFDKSKRMDQSGLGELRASEEILPAAPLMPQLSTTGMPTGPSGSQSQPGSPERVRGTAAGGSGSDGSPSSKARHRSGSSGRTRVEEAAAALPAGVTSENAAAGGAVEAGASLIVSSNAVGAAMNPTSQLQDNLAPPPAMSCTEPLAEGTSESASSDLPKVTVTSTAPPPVPMPVPIFSQFTPYVKPSSLSAAAAPFPASATPTAMLSAVTKIAPETAATACPAGFTVREGLIESCKTESAGDTSYDQAIVKGAFRMEENVKVFVGARVMTSDGKEGQLVAPFGKMGKFKVKFEAGCAGPLESTVFVYIPQ